jgi:hypothetical protein
MLRLVKNDRSLDLMPGASIEMLLNNPMFLSDNVFSDYSFGIQIPRTDNNMRELGDVFSEDIKLATYFDYDVYDDNNFFFSCKLVIDKPTAAIRNNGKSYAEGYLLGGIGNFFYDIKYQRLGQLKLGGPRTFNFTTWDPYDGSNGFWQHLHATWNGAFDYVCLPYINEALTINDTAEATRLLEGWINRLDFGTLYNGWVGSDGSSIVPGGDDIRMARNYQPVLSIKVKYLMQQICEENGWTLDSSLIDAENFDKILQIGSIPIRIHSDLPGNTPISTTFSLGNLISPEITCTDFIMQRCKRYGWWPSIDVDQRVIKIVPLKNAGNGAVKDYTSYAEPLQVINASTGIREFSFKNSFPTTDSFPTEPDFSEYTIGSPVRDAEHLPPANGAYDKFVILCIKENAFYHIVYSEDLPLTDPVTKSRKWEWFADNIYNFVPKEATDSFESKVTPMPIHWSVFRSNSANEIFYCSFLRCSMTLLSEWGMRDVFYLGKVSEYKIGLPLPDGFTYNGQMSDYLALNGSIDKMLTAGPYQFPFASPIPVLPDGTVVGNWANVFKVPLKYTDADGTDHAVAYMGIINFWFQKWLRMNSNSITNQVLLNLPLHELLSFVWDSIINILNVPYLLVQMIVPIPYTGSAQATLQPVILDPNVLNDTRYPYKGPIYLKLAWEDIVDAPDETFDQVDDRWTYTLDMVKKAVAKIYVFADEEGTVPISPNNLAVVVYRNLTYPDGTPPDYEAAFMININEPVIQLSPVTPELYSYRVSTSVGTVFTPQVGYVIQSSSNYQLIS